MEILAILIGLVSLAAIAFYVSRPLVQARRSANVDETAALTLDAQRESLYTQIKELDLDHATGKINEDDYTRQRAELVTEAASVLKQIDGVRQAPAPVDDVEAMIAARRKPRSATAATPAAAPKTADVDLEAAIAARRKTAPAAGAELKCPKCGKPIRAEDAFCAKCGTALRTQVAP